MTSADDSDRVLVLDRGHVQEYGESPKMPLGVC